ncbi:MAG: HD domain-containing protein [Pseudomonadota bacterium]
MDPFDLIHEFYDPASRLYSILVSHSEQVAEKALKIAGNVPWLNPDLDFIQQAAMLHDIAIFQTNVPQISCHGKHPYVIHGYLGRQLLESKGFPRHALVCERHVGVGISAEEIKNHGFPLPVQDMVPESIEEIIICFADKFFSKDPNYKKQEKSIAEVMESITRYGRKQEDRFMKWKSLLNYS